MQHSACRSVSLTLMLRTYTTPAIKKRTPCATKRAALEFSTISCGLVRVREAYEADITYGTNSEFGFDYLRDNISYKRDELRQRGHSYAIVDEIDSILIDEARTPLIISAPAAESEDLYRTFAEHCSKANSGRRIIRWTKSKKPYSLTDAGIEHAEKLLGIENIYTEKGIKYVHHLETAVRAKALVQQR